MEKAKDVYVRIGFSDQVVSLKDAVDPNKEICSCDSYVVGYEDKDGRECNSDGVYLDQPSNQIDLLDMIENCESEGK